MKQEQIYDFGETSQGQKAHRYVLSNGNGMSACVTDYGAALVQLFAADREGKLRDVVLGYDSAAEYEKGDKFFGAPVGRNANRIGGASLAISGQIYELDKNDNGNNLHSGNDYYNKRFWQVLEQSGSKITFMLHSPDKDQGFPGALDMKVSYELTQDNALCLSYEAAPDKDTVINMTNHSYFNLDGHDSGDVLKHMVTADADYFTRADAESIPTGELVSVEGTPMDFRRGRVIGAGIDAAYEATRLGQGYDHNWVLKNGGKFGKVAEVAANESGIVMEISTDLPGMQIYTGNFLTGQRGKGGALYGRRSGVCFETQYFPDAVHHEHFASPICKAGQTYRTHTSFRFSAR